jgi:phosphonate transport system substrate-binding protein
MWIYVMRFMLLTPLSRLTRLSALMLCLLTGHAHSEQPTYSVGVVPQFGAQQTVETWQPILDVIRISSGVHLQLETSPSIPEFEKKFEAGEFDFAYMNPYHLIVANEKEGYLPLVHDIGHKLAGIIVVRNDSPLSSVKELDGRTVAFPAPNALGASLMPRADFNKNLGIKVEELYVNSHNSVYLNVLLNQVDAGGGVQKTLERQPDNIRSQLRVLYKTKEVAPHPFVAHPRISKNVRNKVSAALLGLGKTESGRALLEKIPIKEIGNSSIKNYETLRDMGLSEFYIKN